MAHRGGGWIKAHRRLFDPDFAWPLAWRYYFLDLVQQASYEPTAELKRGQLRASIRFLAARWDVAKATVGRVLEHLESDGAIERDRILGADARRDAGGTVSGTPTGLITITNYATYQATNNQAGHPAERRRDASRDEDKKLRSKNLHGRDLEHPHPPSAAAPDEPTQRTQWPAELQKVWDVLLGNELLGTDLDKPAWWQQQLDWIESTGLDVYPLDELKAYIAHQVSIRPGGKGHHKNRRRGFRNWLATAVRWKERDAAREAIRDRDRTRR